MFPVWTITDQLLWKNKKKNKYEAPKLNLFKQLEEQDMVH